MNTAKRLQISALTFGLVLALLVIQFGTVSAQESAEDRAVRLETLRTQLEERREQTEATREAISEAKTERIKNACTAALTKVEAHSQRIEGFRQAHAGGFDRLISRLETFSESLGTSSIDLTSLNAAIELLKTKQTQLKSDFSVYEGLVTEVLATDCENVDAQGLNDLMQDAREANSVVKATISDIKTHISEVIRPELVNIKTQLEEEPTEEEL